VNLIRTESSRGTFPAAQDSERVLLGCILLDDTRLAQILSGLSPEDFFLDSHRRILEAMRAQYKAAGSVDSVTLCQFLSDRKDLETVGGWSYVSDLTSDIPARMQIDAHVTAVKNSALLRRLATFFDRMKGEAIDGANDALATASRAISELSTIAAPSQSDCFSSERMAEDAEYRLLDNPTSDAVLATGLPCLDEFTSGGIRLGELWVVGASPGRGKTTLARQIVTHAIRRGVPAYAHSGEMSGESWFDVTACLLAGLPAWKIREPRLMGARDKEALRESIRSLGEMPLQISDSGGIHLDRLIFNATRQKQDRGIQLLAVDYAQIIRAPGKDAREQVTAVAQGLRIFAKENSVAVLLLSQSPRPEGRNLNRRPTMFDLKESGALEEAAHTVILPYRPVDPETGQFTGEDELVIGKQRWGAIGHVNVTLNGEHLRFDER
jgi:replicative DNA helicase